MQEELKDEPFKSEEDRLTWLREKLEARIQLHKIITAEMLSGATMTARTLQARDE